MLERELRVEEEFKRRTEMVEKQRSMAWKTFSAVGAQHSVMIDNAEDVLGVPKTRANGVALTQIEREALVEKRRLLRKTRVESVVLKGPGKAYAFPHDIWHMITSYTDALSSLKLEKTCRDLYTRFNKKCQTCDDSVLLRS